MKGRVVSSLLVILVAALSYLFFTSRSTVTVKTTCGSVTGVTSKTSAGTAVITFFNIPYATPPVGKRRFQPPQVFSKNNTWKTLVDGRIKTEIVCTQPSAINGSAIGTEDCLVLAIRTTGLTGSKPVIVWIHGGRFIHGSCCVPGYSFDDEMTETLEVVSVNINYRLGFLGFSSMKELWDEEKGIYANNGIRDQIAALQWIHDNISNFGGDPNSVTIMGESAGGTSVLALVSSPLAVGLFHRAVALSPGPEQRFDYKQGDNFQRETFRVLEGVGCDHSGDAKECLLNVPAKYFTLKAENNAEGKVSPSRLAYFRFPRSLGEANDIGGYIITEPTVLPQNLRSLATADVSPGFKVKVLVSNLAQETAVSHMRDTSLSIKSYGQLNKTLAILFRKITTDPGILDKIYGMYGRLSPQFLWDTLITDMRSTCPTNDVVAAMSTSNSHVVYRLFIDYNITPPGIPAYHTFDTDVLFGFVRFGFDKSILTPQDFKLRDVLIDILKKFVTQGRLTDEWEPFPVKTMIIRNEKNLTKISKEMPHERHCDALEKLDLVKYGWQN